MCHMRPKRPSKKQSHIQYGQLGIRVGPAYKRKVEAFAKRNYLTVSSLVRKALDQEMARAEAAKGGLQ